MSKVESFQNIQFSKEEKSNLNRRSQEIARKIAKQKKEERK